MSEIVITGKFSPYSFWVRGSISFGPVDPMHPPITFAHITKYFGIQNIPEINNLETGYARLKTNTSTADHGDINATIKIPFVGFANELLTDVSTDNENLGESKHA